MPESSVSVLYLPACTSFYAGCRTWLPSCLVLVATLLLPFQPLPPPLFPVHLSQLRPLLPPPPPPPPRPRCPFASLPLPPLLPLPLVSRAGRKRSAGWGVPRGASFLLLFQLFVGLLRRDPVFVLLLLLGRRRLRSLRRVFRFRLRLATDMRDEAAGAHRGKEVSRRLILVHVLW